jgi:hypothetical protein
LLEDVNVEVDWTWDHSPDLEFQFLLEEFNDRMSYWKTPPSMTANHLRRLIDWGNASGKHSPDKVKIRWAL